jgi:hypothetical protein
MNIKSQLIGLLALALATVSQADTQTISTITTNAGKTYQNCRIFKVDPDGVMFSHSRGGAKVLFGELSAEVQSKLGYDRDKEAAYNQAHAEKIQKEREQMLAYQRELAKAEAAAQAVELKKLEIIRQQTYGGDYAGFGGSLVTPGIWNDAYYNGYNGVGSIWRDGAWRHRSSQGRYVGPGDVVNNGSGNAIGRRYCPPGAVTTRPGLGIPALGALAPSMAPAR